MTYFEANLLFTAGTTTLGSKRRVDATIVEFW